MANISNGTIIPYAKVNNEWLKGSTFHDLMECLASISYDCEGTIVEESIGICGRWSIYSTYSSYLPQWKVYQQLKDIMKTHQIEELKIYYSDIESGVGFMDFGVITIKLDSDSIQVQSNCLDFESMEKSKDWLKAQCILEFVQDNDIKGIDEELLYEELDEARVEYFYHLEQQFFETINL